MIVGCYYPPLYYLFKCQPTAQVVYLVLITLLGVIGVYISMSPTFASPKYRAVRASKFNPPSHCSFLCLFWMYRGFSTPSHDMDDSMGLH